MNDNRCNRFGGGSALQAANTDAARKAPRLVLGSGIGFATQLAEDFRQLGWDVHTVADGADVRKLARRKHPFAVLLSAEAANESGYLTCVKLRQDQPRVRVVLVGESQSAEAERFARFVGASFVTGPGTVDEVTNLLKGSVGF